jgi:hypothetical protein
MAHAELLLEFLEVALDAPAQLGNPDQLLKRRGGRSLESLARVCRLSNLDRQRFPDRGACAERSRSFAHTRLRLLSKQGISRGLECWIRRPDGLPFQT